MQSVKVLPKSIIYLFAKKYIAGKTLEAGVEATKRLNSHGISATMDLLGESVTEKEDAIKFKNQFIELLDVIEKENLDSNISTKPTQFGLKIGLEFCYKQYVEIVERAKLYDNFVRIDMEDSSTTSDIIELFKRLHAVYPNNVGIVLQAYLRRTLNDVLELNKLRSNYRLCKGIYIEQKDIAYKGKEEIRDNFISCLSKMFDDGCYVGIATHDDPIVERAYNSISERRLKKDRYEFQMLFGVKEGLRNKINSDGHKMRVYVPFGEHWYYYAIRRLQENPQLAWYIFKSLFSFSK